MDLFTLANHSNKKISSLAKAITEDDNALAEFSKVSSRENRLPLKRGADYLIRTVTMYYTGKVVDVTPTSILLADAAWIPDTGRYHECLNTGKLAVIEPYPDTVVVGSGGFIDAAPWTHALPRNAK